MLKPMGCGGSAATNESSVDQIMANAAKHNYLIEDEAV